MEVVKEKFSFSKLDNFNTCPRQYYLTYVDKKQGENNVYGYLGGVFHQLLEDLQNKHIGVKEAVKVFKEEFDFSQVMELEFPTEKSAVNYRDNLLKYLEDYVPIKCDEFHTEEYFEMEIEGITMRGYIDLYYIIDNDIYVVDYKTSSKFSKKELPKKERQLLLYGMYLKEKYPDKNLKSLAFDMCKYSITPRGALKERTELRNIEKAYVYVDFTDEKVQDLKNFIRNTEGKIATEELWERNDGKENMFFCKNLCSVRRYCK